jgi:hypothetical protein
MPTNSSEKEKLVNSLLESLHYGKPKEDTVIIDQLCGIFHVPNRKKLRDHLIETVDFSELFAALLKLAEPFTQMMKEIYEFLAAQRAHSQITSKSGGNVIESRHDDTTTL